LISWNASGGIEEIKCQFDLVTVSSTQSLPLLQTFEARFHEASAKKPPSVKFSGNPGYIVGQPLRAGKMAADRSAGYQFI